MARAIDASELIVEIQACSWDSEQDKERAEDLVLGMPTLTPPNEWVRVKDAMPPEHEPVLCIVSGSPKPNIIEWTDADVLWWRMLPAPPDCRPPEGEA